MQVDNECRMMSSHSQISSPASSSDDAAAAGRAGAERKDLLEHTESFVAWGTGRPASTALLSRLQPERPIRSASAHSQLAPVTKVMTALCPGIEQPSLGIPTPHGTMCYHSIAPGGCVELGSSDSLVFLDAGRLTLREKPSASQLLAEGASLSVLKGTQVRLFNYWSASARLLTVSLMTGTFCSERPLPLIVRANLDDAIRHPAPDGSEVRVLANSPTQKGGLAVASLAPGATSTAVYHRSVEEVWFVRAGSGVVSRTLGGHRLCESVQPGSMLRIPVGTTFQFKSDAMVPLEFLMATLPSWPGFAEASVSDDNFLGMPSPVGANGLAYLPVEAAAVNTSRQAA